MFKPIFHFKVCKRELKFIYRKHLFIKYLLCFVCTNLHLYGWYYRSRISYPYDTDLIFYRMRNRFFVIYVAAITPLTSQQNFTYFRSNSKKIALHLSNSASLIPNLSSDLFKHVWILSYKAKQYFETL